MGEERAIGLSRFQTGTFVAAQRSNKIAGLKFIFPRQKIVKTKDAV
jgi:hypothetical protein